MATNINISEWLNEHFIEQALRNGEKNDKIQVRKIHVQPATSAGDNYGSIMLRVNVDYVEHSDVNGEVCRNSLILKTLPEVEHAERFVTDLDGFTTEIEVMYKLVPKFHRVINTSEDEIPIILAAKCYYYTDKPHQKIVFEDLSESGFKMAQVKHGLDLDHCKLVVSRLGMFHAASVAVHRQNPRLFDKFLKYPHLKTDYAIRKFVNYTFDIAAEYLQSLSEMGRYFSEKVRRISETSLGSIEKSVQRSEDGFNVLNHGDAWKNNMMFRYDEDGNVSDMRFVDFQFSYYASPVLDLQFFIYSSPSIEVIFDHLDQLLECYHASLSKTLTRLGCADHCPSLEEIRKEMDKRSFFSIYTSISIRPLILLKPDNVPDLDVILGDKPKTNPRGHMTEESATEIVKLLQMFEVKGSLH